MFSGKSEEKLWVDFQQKGDRAARKRLIEIYAPLIKYVSGRLTLFVPPTIEPEDLIGYGAVGLIQAVDRFDPSRGIKFTTYAVARIRGAMLDGMRKSDWFPRSLRQKERQLHTAYQKVANKLGRSPNDREMADELQLSIEAFRELLHEVRQTTLLSLDDIFPDQDGTGASAVNMFPSSQASEPESLLAQAEIKEIIAKAIDKLPERERLVVSLYYYEGFTLKEIATTLEVSESRVSQLHTKAILRLRGRLGSRKKDLGG
ncbi:MAG: FliA/WhiG family RNA polymerase sigma factor [Firmicutes bacterium]|nr:FliA/WhiG family RNA polymerase sigma factor [Bacillota bacterium]